MFIKTISENLVNSQSISEIMKEKVFGSYDITARSIDGRHYILAEKLSEVDADLMLKNLECCLNGEKT